MSDGKLSPGPSRRGDSIYLWHGTEDEIVLPLSVINSYNFLRRFVPQASSIHLDNTEPANHGLASLNKGKQCGVENKESFVERCNVSTVNRMLNHLFEPRLHGQKLQQHWRPLEAALRGQALGPTLLFTQKG